MACGKDSSRSAAMLARPAPRRPVLDRSRGREAMADAPHQKPLSKHDQRRERNVNERMPVRTGRVRVGCDLASWRYHLEPTSISHIGTYIGFGHRARHGGSDAGSASPPAHGPLWRPYGMATNLCCSRPMLSADSTRLLIRVGTLDSPLVDVWCSIMVVSSIGFRRCSVRCR